MLNWLDFTGRLEGQSWYLFLIPVALACVFYIYQKTNPTVSPRRRWALAGLRGGAVFLLILVLAEPVLDIWRKEIIPPALLVLVDTSASMAIETDGKSRLDEVNEVLRSDEFQRKLEKTQVLASRFAEKPISFDLDTLSAIRPRGKATDIARAINQSLNQITDRRQVQGILLLSDGRHNLGADPVLVAEENSIPVFALGIGKAEDPPDIQIVQASAPEIGYLNQDLEIEVQVRSWGLTDRLVQLQVYEGERELARRDVELAGDGRIKQAEFRVRPTEAGPHIYRVLVVAAGDEVIRDNNEALVFTRILEERIRVLLVSGGPSPDLAFLQRSLSADSNIVVEKLVHKNDRVFYQEEVPGITEWADRDVVILLDAGAMLTSSEAQILQRRIKAGGGLLYIGGPKTVQTWPQQGALEPLLSEIWTPASSRFVVGELGLQASPEGRRHPVIRSKEEIAGQVGDLWDQLPPLPGYLPIAAPKNGIRTLVEGKGENRPPLLLAGAYGNGKVIAALSSGFWKLDLQSSGVDGNPQVIRGFWLNAVKWLALKTAQGQVRVSTEQFIYRAGEEVVFAAQVFDELYRPLSQATVQVNLAGDKQTLQLLNRGGGHYRALWKELPPGDYSYRATGQMEETLVGEDSGRFIIEQYSVESTDMRVNAQLLGEISQSSGGLYRPLAEWREIVDQLPLEQSLVEEADSLALWEQTWLLSALVVLLGLEWTVRRRSGMI